jgi:hypothetical protein
MIDYELGSILRAAKFCGDCGRNFDDCDGDHVYPRIGPARLICLDCKLKEPANVTPPK